MTSWNTGPPADQPDRSAYGAEQNPTQYPKQYPPNNSGHTYTPADFPYGGYPGDVVRPAPPIFPSQGYPQPSGRTLPPVRSSGQPASMGNRLVAKLIDGLIVSLPFGVLYVWATNAHNSTAETLISLAAAVVTFVYETYFISARGATIGKQMRGIAIVNEATGQRLTPGNAFRRSFIQYVSNYVILAGCWSPFLDRPRMRGWHDKAAGDVVINSR